MDVLNPTNDTVTAKASQAKRLGTLAGKTIGVIDNGKDHSDVILQTVSGELKDRYQAKAIIFYHKPSFSHPIPHEKAQDLAAQCDGMITGTGD